MNVGLQILWENFVNATLVQGVDRARVEILRGHLARIGGASVILHFTDYGKTAATLYDLAYDAVQEAIAIGFSERIVHDD